MFGRRSNLGQPNVSESAANSFLTSLKQSLKHANKVKLTLNFNLLRFYSQSNVIKFTYVHIQTVVLCTLFLIKSMIALNGNGSCVDGTTKPR